VDTLGAFGSFGAMICGVDCTRFVAKLAPDKSSGRPIPELCARLANPMSVALCKPSVLDFTRLVESLEHFTDEVLTRMVGSYSDYLQKCVSFAEGVDRNAQDYNEITLAKDFWSIHAGGLEAFTEFAKYCFSLAPSSGAAERVFSVLKNFYDMQQMRSSLEDTVFLSVMLSYNN
jgi:hypothetical protein